MNMKSPLRLRKRAEFLAMRAGERRRGAYFLLEIKKRPLSADITPKAPDICQKKKKKKYLAKDPLLPRVGFTVTRKNGNAVARNRIKRRLREALRVGIIQDETALMRDMEAQTDYVIVARKDALKAPFTKLILELRRRIRKKNKPQ